METMHNGRDAVAKSNIQHNWRRNMKSTIISQIWHVLLNDTWIWTGKKVSKLSSMTDQGSRRPDTQNETNVLL